MSILALRGGQHQSKSSSGPQRYDVVPGIQDKKRRLPICLTLVSCCWTPPASVSLLAFSHHFSPYLNVLAIFWLMVAMAQVLSTEHPRSASHIVA